MDPSWALEARNVYLRSSAMKLEMTGIHSQTRQLSLEIKLKTFQRMGKGSEYRLLSVPARDPGYVGSQEGSG